MYQWIEKLKEYTIYKSKNNDDTENSDCIEKNEPTKDFKRFSRDVVHGPIIEDRKSVFQGHVCSVSNEVEVK